MCKVGIFLIGIDLYHSTSTLFQKLILHKTGSYLDLIVHIIGLMTLLLAYRGRVKRNIAGKVVLPVMILAFQGDDSCVGENEWFPWQQQHQESANVVVEKSSEVKKKD
ncbi:hypothetical protein ACHAWC_002761 [Mediolabrus comicus]